jgi:Fe-S-cluster-containing dehydrogenase component
MTKVFLMDVARCNGCHNCQIACKEEHCDTDWPPYAAAQPDTGQFWMKVDEKVRGSVPKVMISYIPHGCMHCADALCMAAAESAGVSEAIYRREDGLVVIDPEKAKGLRAVMEACPYGAVYWNESLELPQKCTGCAHLLDDGWEVPRCVESCAMEALRYLEEGEAAELIAQAEVFQPEAGTSPRFYYLNLPKRFVAGEVYDQEADEVIVGVQVTLTAADGTSLRVETDDFGDFWFRQVEPTIYTVALEAEGYLSQSMQVDVTAEDVNIGSMSLFKAVAK